MMVMKRGRVVGGFAWVTLSYDCQHELHVEWIRASR